MTIEEKLENFSEISLETAKNMSISELEKYQKMLDEAFLAHKKTAEQRAEQMRDVLSAESRIESNRLLSSEFLSCRKRIGDTEEELTEALFSDAAEKLDAFRKTPGYSGHLKNLIAKGMEYAAGAHMKIEIAEQDRDLIPALRAVTKDQAEFAVYKSDMPGGLRILIPEKNIMLDRTFRQKFYELKENYQLEQELKRAQ